MSSFYSVVKVGISVTTTIVFRNLNSWNRYRYNRDIIVVNTWLSSFDVIGRVLLLTITKSVAIHYNLLNKRNSLLILILMFCINLDDDFYLALRCILKILSHVHFFKFIHNTICILHL